MTNLLDDILNDAEKEQVRSFTENEVMREAVKKCILAGVYYNGTLEKGKPAEPLRNFAIGLAFNDPKLSNEQVGADLKTTIAGINTLEVAFNKMASYKYQKVEELEKNEAI